MSDYIKREDALIECANSTGLTMAHFRLLSIPSADVAPVKHGYWQITDAYPHNVYCSECHTKYAQTHWGVWEDGSLPRRFCPNCGAIMDGELIKDERIF